MNSSPLELEGQNTASIYMVVDDADAHYQKAISCGAEIIFDIKDEDSGGRGYTCKVLDIADQRGSRGYTCKDLEGHLRSFGSYNPWE